MHPYLLGRLFARVRYAQLATELLRCRGSTRWATRRHPEHAAGPDRLTAARPSRERESLGREPLLATAQRDCIVVNEPRLDHGVFDRLESIGVRQALRTQSVAVALCVVRGQRRNWPLEKPETQIHAVSQREYRYKQRSAAKQRKLLEYLGFEGRVSWKSARDNSNESSHLRTPVKRFAGNFDPGANLMKLSQRCLPGISWPTKKETGRG